MRKIKLSKMLNPAFWILWNLDVITTAYLVGGRGSGKTVTLIILTIYHLYKDDEANALLMRFQKATLRRSLYTECIKVLRRLDLIDDFKIGRSALQITRKKTGQMIFFDGLYNSGGQRIKGIVSEYGFIKVIAIDEISEIKNAHYVELQDALLSARGSETVYIYYSTNPTNKFHWTYKIFKKINFLPNKKKLKEKGYQQKIVNGTLYHYSNFKANKYLQEEYKTRLLELPEDFRNRLAYGMWENVGDLCYPGIENYIKSISKIDAMNNYYDVVVVGIDPASGNAHPFAATITALDYEKKRVVMFDSIKFEPTDTRKFLYEEMIKEVFNKILIWKKSLDCDQFIINVDAASPETAQILNRHLADTGLVAITSKRTDVESRIRYTNYLLQTGSIYVVEDAMLVIEEMAALGYEYNKNTDKYTRAKILDDSTHSFEYCMDPFWFFLLPEALGDKMKLDEDAL